MDERKADSRTEVHSRSGGAPGKWGGPRLARSMRVDEGLYQAFKRRTRELATTVCAEVETFMIAYLGATDHLVKDQVHIGTTINLEQTVFRQLGRDRRSLRRSPEEVRMKELSSREKESRLVAEWSLRIFETFVSEGLDPNRLSALYPFLHDVPENIRSKVREAVIDRLVAMVHGVQEVARA